MESVDGYGCQDGNAPSKVDNAGDTSMYVQKASKLLWRASRTGEGSEVPHRPLVLTYLISGRYGTCYSLF